MAWAQADRLCVFVEIKTLASRICFVSPLLTTIDLE